jgi:hypothetical protein
MIRWKLSVCSNTAQVVPSVVSLTVHLSQYFCRDGIKRPPDDEKFIVTNVLMYHPERKKKIAGNGNYITVSNLPS